MAGAIPSTDVSQIQPIGNLTGGTTANDIGQEFTTPALQNLEGAFNKGLVSADQIQGLLKGGMDMAKQRQVNLEDIQSSKERLAAGVPKQQAEAAAEIARANAAKARLEGVAASGAMASTRWEAALSQKDPSGNLGRLVNIYMQSDPTGQVPLGDDGLPDTNAIKQRFGIDTGDNSTASTINFLTGQGVKDPRILRHIDDNFLKNSPDGQGVADKLKQKNITLDTALWDHAAGKIRNPMELLDYAENAPPQVVGEGGQNAATAYKSAVEHLRRLDYLQNILQKNPNAIGPQWNKGSWSGQLLAALTAYGGGSPAQYTDQESIKLGLYGEKSDFASQAKNIRNVFEFKTYTGQAPDLKDPIEVWNNYFNTRRATISDDLKMLKPMLDNYSNQLPAYSAPEPPAVPTAGAAGGPPLPAGQNLADLPKGGQKLTPQEVEALPVGTAYISPNGLFAVKQGPPGATP
jgi:hypothetical protein